MSGLGINVGYLAIQLLGILLLFGIFVITAIVVFFIVRKFSNNRSEPTKYL